jgi:hypothetical protein
VAPRLAVAGPGWIAGPAGKNAGFTGNQGSKSVCAKNGHEGGEMSRCDSSPAFTCCGNLGRIQNTRDTELLSSDLNRGG